MLDCAVGAFGGCGKLGLGKCWKNINPNLLKFISKQNLRQNLSI